MSDDAEKKAAKLVADIYKSTGYHPSYDAFVIAVAAALREKDALAIEECCGDFKLAQQAEIAALKAELERCDSLKNSGLSYCYWRDVSVPKLQAELETARAVAGTDPQLVTDLETQTATLKAELEAARAAGKALYEAADQARQAAEQAEKVARDNWNIYERATNTVAELRIELQQ